MSTLLYYQHSNPFEFWGAVLVVIVLFFIIKGLVKAGEFVKDNAGAVFIIVGLVVVLIIGAATCSHDSTTTKSHYYKTYH